MKKQLIFKGDCYEIHLRQYIVSGQPWEHLVPHTSARIMKEMGIIERIKKLVL